MADNNIEEANFSQAIQDFRQARRRASMQEIMSYFTGKPTNLLPFDEVKERLKVSGMIEKGLQEIPLEAIVGSVGRYADFTRTFLPRRDEAEHRWAKVQVATTGLIGVPPISVYQVNDSYFVIDGNHRVSVARQLGAKYIEAYVTEVRTKIPFSPDDNLDDVILKAEYVDFLERTQLDKSRPQADFRTTAPGKYWILEAQIEAYCYTINGRCHDDQTYYHAATRWYDEVYRPMIQIIQDRAILQDFPDRTETDLYIWLAEHRAALKQALGWEVDLNVVITDLTEQFGPRLPRLMERITNRVLDIVAITESPAELDTTTKDRLLSEQEQYLFFNVLAAISDDPKGWQVLEQAVEVAQRETGKVLGLHVVGTEADKEAPTVKALKDRFNQFCDLALVPGMLAIDVGVPVNKIVDRAWLADLVVVPLNHPPSTTMLAWLNSGFRTLIQRCGRPVLAVPEQASRFTQALLTYDGSAKAKEALFVATYLAGKWSLPLVVLTVAETNVDVTVMYEAQDYLTTYGVTATYVMESGPVVPAILQTRQRYGCDLIIIGGYGHSSIIGAVLGNYVDQLLRECHYPMLICR